MQITESHLIEAKDSYLELVSDTHDQITRNHNKSGRTNASGSMIAGRVDLEGASFRPIMLEES